jgi:hypothetical protein
MVQVDVSGLIDERKVLHRAGRTGTKWSYMEQRTTTRTETVLIASALAFAAALLRAGCRVQAQTLSWHINPRVS